MIGDIKSLAELWGVPKLVTAVLLSVAAIVTITVLSVRSIDSHETKLNRTVQYMPESRRMDSLILDKVIHIESKYDSRFDTLSKGIKSISAVMKSYNTVTNQKFNFLIEHNSAFKTYFDGLDNSLNCLIQLLPQSSFYQKKKDWQIQQLADQL